MTSPTGLPVSSATSSPLKSSPCTLAAERSALLLRQALDPFRDGRL